MNETGGKGMTIFNFISLFGGLALFLYGMRLMGDGLKQGSSAALKKAMEKVTNNPIIGFLLGLLVTAVIQSSTATIVLTSGLVGAGILTYLIRRFGGYPEGVSIAILSMNLLTPFISDLTKKKTLGGVK